MGNGVGALLGGAAGIAGVGVAGGEETEETGVAVEARSAVAGAGSVDESAGVATACCGGKVGSPPSQAAKTARSEKDTTMAANQRKCALTFIMPTRLSDIGCRNLNGDAFNPDFPDQTDLNML